MSGQNVKYPADSNATLMRGRTINPSDTIDIAGVDKFGPTRAIWVGNAGDIAVIMADGREQIWPNASGMMPIQATRVLKTGTTATSMVAGW